MLTVCATHGHCFDGLCSAVLFRELQKKLFPSSDLKIIACGYGTKQTEPNQEMLSGDQNAVLDFRYVNVPRLTFYFDHHKTAFLSPEDHGDFERRAAEDPSFFVFAPEETSCTKLLNRVLTESHGLDLSRYADLVQWADVVDSARFASAAAATDTAEPVLQLVSVVEQFGDDAFLTQLVSRIESEGLDDVAKSALVREKFRGIAPQQQAYTARVKEKGQMMGSTVLVDLTEKRVTSMTKFAAYAAFPSATYSVLVALQSSGIKISVGHNPWSGKPREHDISAICRRYGGGGHPVVGGIALGKGEVERARAIARTIAEELG